jgi:predicted DNA-binding transcriptional regulator YafY
VRADRLVSLILLLQARGRVTARALAGELGVSVRTVYRDLAALGAAGVPVVTGSGPGGGCRPPPARWRPSPRSSAAPRIPRWRRRLRPTVTAGAC